MTPEEIDQDWSEEQLAEHLHTFRAGAGLPDERQPQPLDKDIDISQTARFAYGLGLDERGKAR